MRRLFGALLWLSVPVFLACSDWCTRTLRSTTPSPNGQSRADVYLDDCGATTDFTTGVFVREADDRSKPPERYDIGLRRGRAPRVEDGGPDLRVNWSGDSVLIVYFDSVADLGPRPSQVGGVRIHYAPYGLAGVPLRGPELHIDSSLTQPRLDTLEDVYVVRLPYDMAQILRDSLPGFTPFPQTDYPIQFAAAHRAPLSVVLGDFNGDSVRDIAMLGELGRTPALVIMLAKSAEMPEPRLVSVLTPVPHTRGDLRTHYIERVRPQTFTDSRDPRIKLDVRTDAVKAFGETVSTIYYWRDGRLRQLRLW